MNLVGVEVPKTTLLRHVAGIGEEIQAFEREDAEASPPAGRVLLGIGGTGVPMTAQEIEGVALKSTPVRIVLLLVCPRCRHAVLAKTFNRF